MKELSKKDFDVIEEFIEPYREVLEEILLASDVHSKAQHQAWEDWSIELLIDTLGITPKAAKEWIVKLENYYKEKKSNDTN